LSEVSSFVAELRDAYLEYTVDDLERDTAP
jgi:hypothetical protein